MKGQLLNPTVVVSTASPYKFIETVNEVFKINKEGYDLVKEVSKITTVKYPDLLNDIYNNKMNKVVWTKDEMEEKLINLIGEIDESC